MPAAADDAGRWTGAPVAHGARVLVVADDPQAGAELGTMLIGAGFDVPGPPVDCCRAVIGVTEVRPDLVVMNVGVSDTDGPAAVIEISDRAIPVVLLTPPSRAGLIERAGASGAMACLVTPFVQPTLLNAVELVLARHAEQGVGRAGAPDLTRRLQERNLIERAKALLMLHQQMTEAQAHRWLQQASMDRRDKVTGVATGVIDRLVVH